MKCNAHICCLYFITSNPRILHWIQARRRAVPRRRDPAERKTPCRAEDGSRKQQRRARGGRSRGKEGRGLLDRSGRGLRGSRPIRSGQGRWSIRVAREWRGRTGEAGMGADLDDETRGKTKTGQRTAARTGTGDDAGANWRRRSEAENQNWL
jgi:hypothetical protein